MAATLFLGLCSAPLRAILHDRRGTSLIEFGVAAPVLLIFLVGISDLGRGLSERYRLQQVVNRSLEIAQIDQAGDYTDLETEAQAAAGTGSTATVDQWTSAAGARGRGTTRCPSGEPARFVKLTLTRGFTPLFGTVGYPNVQSDGTVRLTAHATLRVS